MDDLKSVTVGYLRELARQHLGTGYSKLKKEELIAALAAYVPAVAKLARLAGIALPRQRATPRKADAKQTESVKTRTEGASKAKAPGGGSASKAAPRAGPKEMPKAASRAAASKEAPKAAPKAAARPAPKEATRAAPKAAAKEARKEGPKARPPAAAPSKARDSSKAAAPSEPRAAAPESKEKAVGQGRVSAPNRVAAKRASEKPGEATPARPAKVVNFPPKPRSSREPAAEPASEPTPAFMASSGGGGGGGGGSPPSGGDSPSQPETPPPAEQHAAEPLVEGFFVARVMGEGEVRTHHMVGDPPRESEPLDRPEREGGSMELPPIYEDDTALLLPRDPYTLFVSWDFSAASRNRAMQGLDSPRAVLRVFDGEGLVRELEVSLESRSHYIHELTPGRPYRVEAHFVGSDGRSRRIGPSTNRVHLPSVGPSQDTSIRFLRVPTRMPEPQPVPEAAPPPRARVPAPEEREYITWRRVNLPGSGGFEDVPEVRRERQTPELPEAQPGPHLEGPPRPVGASDQRYLESMERAPGASDQRYLESVERAPGASEQRYLESVERPAGASEQRYLEAVARPGGASDQRYLQGSGQPGGHSYLEVGRAPGASEQRYLESPPRAPGASDQRYLGGASDARYLESPGRAGGASDMRYLESPPRAAGASDLRYLESPGRVAGASDMRYLESPPRAPGASDMRYLEYVARPPGASDQRHTEAGPSPGGSSEQSPSRKPPSGSGHS